MPGRGGKTNETEDEMGTLAALRTAAWSMPIECPSAKNIMFNAADEFEKTIDRAEASEAALEAMTADNNRLRQDRKDALSVVSTDGMSASEWVARTGKAERELEAVTAERGTLDALFEILSPSEIQEMGARLFGAMVDPEDYCRTLYDKSCKFAKAAAAIRNAGATP
jgi:hypothetical protein